MRIVAGEWRGRTIAAPKGDDTRPTIDRVRESLMSVLSSARGSFEGAVVLDAFAGSGALGLEALSRGADVCHFFECDRAAQRTLLGNIEKLVADPSRAVTHRGDVLKTPPVHVRPPFDLVLLDPPYRLSAEGVFAMLDALAESGALAADAIVSYEHAKADDLSAAAQSCAVSWLRVASKVYGKVAVDVFRRTDDEEGEASV